MDHSNAIDTQAVERYLLGELSASEAEEFELHYFACPQCALAVESGGVFIDGARAVWADEKRTSASDRTPGNPHTSFWDAVAGYWTRPAFALPAAAAVLLAC